MATRATYRIKEISYCCGIKQYALQCFYIHWDGYPEGAASYFKSMLENFASLGASADSVKKVHYKRGQAVLAFGMVPLADFTDEKEAHGDTEYHYDVLYDHSSAAWHVCATKISRWGGDGRIDKEVFNGSLHTFLEAYLKIKDAK